MKMLNILGLITNFTLFVTSMFWPSVEALAQTSPYFSSKLLLPKIFNTQLKAWPPPYIFNYDRMNSNNSHAEFDDDIFGTPHGMLSYVHNQTEFLAVSDVAGTG